MAEEKMIGVVKSFDISKGYGYVDADSLPQPAFVYYEWIIEDRYRALKAGDEVEFSLVEAAEGPRAVEVRKL